MVTISPRENHLLILEFLNKYFRTRFSALKKKKERERNSILLGSFILVFQRIKRFAGFLCERGHPFSSLFLPYEGIEAGRVNYLQMAMSLGIELRPVYTPATYLSFDLPFSLVIPPT